MTEPLIVQVEPKPKKAVPKKTGKAKQTLADFKANLAHSYGSIFPTGENHEKEINAYFVSLVLDSPPEAVAKITEFQTWLNTRRYSNLSQEHIKQIDAYFAEIEALLT
jgi:hypothetical protein